MQKVFNRLTELDALRGVAALGVVWCHLTLNRPQGEHFFKYGFMGVDLFFMISGFVILMTLNQVGSGKEFTLRRISRLYPAYWVGVTLTALCMVAFHVESLNKEYLLKYLANLTMIQPYLLQGNIDDSYWTLIIELQFYLMMLIVFSIDKLKHIEVIGCVILLLLIVCGRILNFHAFSTPHLFMLYRFASIVICFPMFFSGIIFYQLMFLKKTLARYLLLLLCLITKISFGTSDPRLLMVQPYKYYLVLLLFNLIFELFINGKLKFIVNSLTLFFGKISYPLYLINTYIGVKALMPLFTRHFSFWPAAFIDLGIISWASFLITKYIERPALRFARKKWLIN